MLVLGTRNRKKGLELRSLLAPLGYDLRTLAEIPEAIDVVEDGDSFQANAVLKATRQARHLVQWVIGEDSGLSVEALGGQPGVYSARFAGPHATDSENNSLLIRRLEGVPRERRWAHYTCHMTLSDPAGNVCADSEGICRGRILTEPRGSEGFGYDPLFEVVEYHQTFGELGEAVKAVLSHRSRSVRQFIPLLRAATRNTALPQEGQMGRPAE